MLLRIRDFGAAHRERFPESSGGGQALAIVAKAVAEIEAHAAAKLVHVREAHRERSARRTIILDRMKAIARTSRGVRTASGALLELPMPRRRSDVAVVTAARAFLREVEPHEDQLVSLGLPPTCLAELRQAAEAFDAALAQGRAGRSGVAAGQAGIVAAIAAGTGAARILDIVVPNTMGQDPVLMAAWARGRRIVEGKTTTEAEPPEPVRATTPAPVAGDATPADAVPAPADPLRRAS
jgi:hypothetical protein